VCRPPIQWSVETSTPATVAVVLAIQLVSIPGCPASSPSAFGNLSIASDAD
jgi:hypothetical protein